MIETNMEVEDLLRWLREYAQSRIDFRLQDERRCVQPHVVLDLGRRGILGGTRIARAYGGLGLLGHDLNRVSEQLGAIDLTLAAWVGQNTWLGVQPILDHGSPAHHQELLPLLARGQMLASFALTEPGAGSDPGRIEATLSPRDDHFYTLRGNKSWIGNAGWAGVINVFARHVGVDGARRGFTACVVRPGAPGMRVGPELLTMGMRAIVQNQISFDDVCVPTTDLLGRPRQGYFVMHSAMQSARIGIAAAAIGAMRRCIGFQYRYGMARRIGAGVLADIPSAAARMNECAAKCHAMRVLVHRVADLDPTFAAARVPDEIFMAAKVLASEFAWEIADVTVQMLGARGYTENNDAARFLRDARVFRIFEGPTEALEYFLGALADAQRTYHFLEQELAASRTVERLRSAMGAIAEETAHVARVLTPLRYEQWLRAAKGKILCWGILLAFLERAQADADKPLDRMTRAWAEARFASLVTATREHSGGSDMFGTACVRDVLEHDAQLAIEALRIDEIHAPDPELRGPAS
jgi:alkylation response protein AidB-like acyl-CoA dehydrogenase